MFKKKIIAFTLIFVCIISGTALAAQTEDALTVRPEKSAYIVIKNEDLSGFLRWLISRNNMKAIAPIVDGLDESSIEMVASVVDNLPLKSAAISAGLIKSGEKDTLPFFQAAFTLHPSASVIADKIEVASAEAKDIAGMLVGKDSPFVGLLETMIKVEREPGKILKVNNEIFMKAEKGVIFVGSDINELKSAYDAFSSGENALVKNFGRKFNASNFAIIHADFDTLALLEETDKEIQEAKKYFAKPINIEFGFDSQPDKLTIGTAINILDALSEKYAKKIKLMKVEPVKGGYISMAGIGGNSSPFLATGGVVKITPEDLGKEGLEVAEELFKFLKKFDITSADFFKLAEGASSLVIGASSVPVEGFKIPSFFITKTGTAGTAEAIFNKIAAKPFFSVVQGSFEGWDKLLQADSSLSPASFLIGLRGDTLGLGACEVSAIGENKALKPTLQNLLSRKSISSMWLDFAAIQDWFNNDDNGVFAILTPLATFSGYGDVVLSLRKLLNAKLSVPSMAFYCASEEVFFFEFDLADVKPEEGFLVHAIDLYKKIEAKTKADEAAKSDKKK